MGIVVMPWLVLVAIPVLGLGHGFAGAATHLPYHPDHALVTVAESFSAPQTCDAEPCGDGHGRISCGVITSSGLSHQPALAAASAAIPDDLVPVALRRSCPMLSRAPPRPSLAALSVLRI